MGTIELAGRRRRVAVTFMDCDGIIFDVNRLKARAFVDALDDYPLAARQRFAAYQRDQGGVSRYVKFRHFFEKIHPVEHVEESVQAALSFFAARSQAAYRTLVPRPEALRFAERMGGASHCYVVSGSDHDELRAQFDHHQIRQHFADVLGSPVTKPEHVSRLLAERRVDPRDALFVGDGRADWDAARGAGMPFVFLQEMSEWAGAAATLDDTDAIVATTWNELLGWLV